jgi:uncharacterized protein YndB with AHSA1/START domain
MDDAVATGTDTALRLWRRFEASPERVFAAWTRPAALRLWWCPAGWYPTDIEVDLRPGGTYRLSMIRESSAQSVAVRGHFLEISPDRKLVYTWRWEGAFPDMPETRVTVDFYAVAGGTELSLRQEPLAMPFCVQHLSGWIAACDRLTRCVSEPCLRTHSEDGTLTGDHAI